jgi:rod shape-determining protein MreD
VVAEVRAVISIILVAVTVVFQLTVVDRIAFPGGAGPDLVLLMVAALALAGGPMAGVLTGFLAGLALDVAPPGSHFVGQNALVFCLVGYLCGLLADDGSGDAEQGHTALFEIVVVAAGAVGGEALRALLGVMLSDPRVTWPAITNVLPAAVAYDVLLCPFVLYAAAAALRLAGVRGEGRRPGLSPSQARTPVSAANQGAIRQLAGGSAPRLRLSERDRGTGSIGGLRGTGSVRPVARREPQLKLGRPAHRTPVGLGAAFAPAGLGASTARVRFGSRRREGVLGGSLLGGSRSGIGSGSARRGSSGLGSTRLGISGSSSMGRSLLGGSVFSRKSSSSLRRPAAFGRSPSLGLASPLRHRGNPAGGGLIGHAPRFSRGSSLTRLTSALRRSAGPKSPGRGWVRGTSSRGAFPRRGSLRSGSLRSGSLRSGSLRSGSLRSGSLRSGSLRSGSLSSGSLGGTSMSRRAFGGRRIGRSDAGLSGRGLSNRSLSGRSGRGLSGRGLGGAGSPRLRMPRPRSRRRWRTGGYR